MRILILVLASKNEPYNEFIKMIRQTWASKKENDVDIFFYYGNNEKFEIIDDEIYSTVREAHNLMGIRTLDVFSYTLNMEYDYLFRVNAGSYVNQKNLLNFLNDKPLDKFYTGIRGYYAGVEYASGSGFIISKDLVEILCKNQNT